MHHLSPNHHAATMHDTPTPCLLDVMWQSCVTLRVASAPAGRRLKRHSSLPAFSCQSQVWLPEGLAWAGSGSHDTRCTCIVKLPVRLAVQACVGLQTVEV